MESERLVRLPTTGREFPLLGMVTGDLERKRCQGRAAPAGFILDGAGAEDRLCHAKKGEQRPRGLTRLVERFSQS